MRQGVIDRGEIPPHDFLPLLAVCLFDRLFNLGDRFLRGKTPETAKKQVCITVLMRLPSSFSVATRSASIT